MNLKKPINAYKTTQANTASPGRLLLMMYEGAIRFLKQAMRANEEKNYDEKLEKIKKVRAIIQEMQRTLDYEKGGQIAFQLDRLYGFVNNRIMRGAVEKQGTSLSEALEVLETLLGSWRTAVNADEGTQKDSVAKQIK